MALDVGIPDPPSLSGRNPGDYEAVYMTDQDTADDYRCGEVETILQAGAWEEAFGQWAVGTSISEDESQQTQPTPDRRQYGLTE